MIRILNRQSGERMEISEDSISRVYTLMLFYHEHHIPFTISFNPKEGECLVQ